MANDISGEAVDSVRTVDVRKCIVSTERSRYILAVAIVTPITLAYILVTVGIGLLIVPPILLGAWISVRLVRAHLLGSCVEVSPDNFPEIYDHLASICKRLEYFKKIEVYVFQEGQVNTFLVRLFRTRMILLPHEVVKGTLEQKEQQQLVWLLARAVGHLKAKHLRLGWLNILVETFEKLFILNLFLYPWERATQYSGDRIGLAVCCDLESALTAMKKLMIGNDLASRATLFGALQQRKRLTGSLFAWLAECLSTHPHLTKRMASLLHWARTSESGLYEKFMVGQQDRKRIESLLL